MSSKSRLASYSAWAREARPSGSIVGFALQLGDAQCNLVCVDLLFVRVLKELRRDGPALRPVAV